ncbi:MAG: metallophosphoesterase [Chitinophagales bacterium]
MSRIINILIVTLILLAIDLYAFQAVRTVMHNSGIHWKRFVAAVYWLISLITLSFLWYVVFFDFYALPKIIRVNLIGALFIFYIPKILIIVFLFIDDVIRLVKWSTSLFTKTSMDPTRKTISRSEFLSQAGLLVSGFIFFQFIYGMIRTAYDYEVRNVNLLLPNLPDEFNGLRIVQVSDIHSGSFTSKHPVEKIVEIVNAQNADIIFFTGDLVNNISDEALEYMEVLNKMKSKNGVVSIFGNHDYGDYYTWDSKEAKEENLVKLENIHKSLGWKLMRNTNFLLGTEGNQLAIIGVDNWSNVGHFPRYGDLKKAFAGAEHARVKLLLSHDPSHWKGEVTRDFPDIDATFSGHTHGFQFGFEIPGLRWSPSQYMYPQWAGLYKNAKQFLYVNRGVGFLGYNGRVGIAPEITVIELRNS